MARTYTPPPPPYAPTPKEIAAEAKRAGFALEREQAEALSRYLTLLLKWNRVMNLVGRAEWPEVFRDLTADSLHLAEFLRTLPLADAPLCLDLGAGAGLPGIPLRVLWPDGHYVMVDLREKRAIFMQQAVAAAGLARTSVLRGRAEECLGGLPGLKALAGREFTPATRADLILSRAFMPWPKLLPLAARLLAPDGLLVVLSNDPPPVEPGGELAGEDEDGGARFTLTASRDYPSPGKRRYFWSLAPAKA